MKFSRLVSLLSSVVVASVVSASEASARGGAIGGGEVNMYPILSCAAESIDPTFPSATAKVVVMGEATYEGRLMPHITLTVGLFDANDVGLLYLPTQTLPAEFDPSDLKTYQYAQTLPNEPNLLTSTFQVNGTSGYLVSATNASYVEELRLTECEYVAHVQ